MKDRDIGVSREYHHYFSSKGHIDLRVIRSSA
jgi:hypothetical protein